MAVGDNVQYMKLSGSSGGCGIKLTTTSTPGDTIHTAPAGTTNFDKIFLWATNRHSNAVAVTFEFGGATSPTCLITKTIPVNDGLYECIPGLPLHDTKVVKAFAAIANVVMIYGEAWRITA